MIQNLKKSDKPIIGALLDVTLENCQSTTGKNMRSILLEKNRRAISDLDTSVPEELKYFPHPEDENWVIDAVAELMEMRDWEGLNEDGDLWLDILCTL